MRVPPYSWLFFLRPRHVAQGLERARAANIVEVVPNLWQLGLGVLRGWHRLLARPETFGECEDHPVRGTLRARLLRHKAIRLPFLLAERAVAPLDFTGLLSSRDRVIRHLLGAHHDGERQFIYDLELLQIHPGGLEELVARVDEVVQQDTPRTRWLRDLVVFEGYHEELQCVARRAVRDGVNPSADALGDPDLSFAAYLRWCASQPSTPSETFRALASGRYHLGQGLRA